MSEHPEHHTAVYYGLEALQDHLENSSYSRIFVLVDHNTETHCLPLLLRAIKIEPQILKIPPGEKYKNIDTCNQVWQDLADAGADRNSLLINLGGGVVTDLGGFVACTFKRGISFIHIPTTLLAMVDAAIGGKTGVDLGILKNQIGVIREPGMVIIHTPFLKTLEDRQVRSGFAEMLKHGLIRDEGYWSKLREKKSFDDLQEDIRRSVEIKSNVVAQDLLEQNLRKILNFGHTLGHAIESHFLEHPDKEQLLHGEAIIIGMLMEAYLSTQISGLDKSQLDEIAHSFSIYFSKVEFSREDEDAVIELLKHDKKNTHGKINFVLLDRIGSPVIDQQVSPDLLHEAFAYYKES